MNDELNLVQRLDAEPAHAWEQVYASAAWPLTQDDIVAVLGQDGPYAHWLACRFEVGRPGRPLPSGPDAMQSVMSHKGTPADAFRLIFADRPLPEGTDREVVLALLVNSSNAALQGGLSWFSAWLAARAGLAAIALGRPDLAWLLLDGLTRNGTRHPHLDKLAHFLPIRGHADLEHSVWVQATIARLWPSLGVPLVATLPVPFDPDTAPAVEGVLAGLRRVGAAFVAELVKVTMNETDSIILERRAAEHIVQALEQMDAVDRLPDLPATPLPPWFPAWARSAFRTGHSELARQAGRLLYRHHPDQAQFAATLVMQRARAADLPLLLAGLPQPKVQALLVELQAAAGQLPQAVADALVSAALPGYTGPQDTVFTLITNLPLLLQLPTTPEGHVAYIVRRTAEYQNEHDLQHAAARSARTAFAADVDRCVQRLGDPRQLTARDVTLAAAGLTLPPIDLAQLQMTQLDEMQKLSRVVQALALCRGLVGSELSAEWRPILQVDAVRTLYKLGVPRLYELRLELLDELIAALPHEAASPAELYAERAATRTSLLAHVAGTMELVQNDVILAFRFARKANDVARLVAAVIALAKSLAFISGGHTEVEQLLETQVTFLLQRSISDRLRATVLQAVGYLMRNRDVDAAADAFRTAMELLPPDEPYRWELAADWIQTSIPAGRASRAGEQGLRWLEMISERSSDITVGGLHFATARALDAGRVSYAPEARRQYEAALRRLRGEDVFATAETRLSLAAWGLRHGDRNLVEEQLRTLEADAAELSSQQQGWLRNLRDQAQRAPVEQPPILQPAQSERQGNAGNPSEDKGLAHVEGALVALQANVQVAASAAVEADRAWTVVLDSAPRRLLDRGGREREADLALRFAAHLSTLLSDDQRDCGSPVVLVGEPAETVTRWLLRSQASLRRPVIARLRRPDDVPLSVWLQLEEALQLQDPARLSIALSQAHETAPNLLREDIDIGRTWPWLEARPGAVAVVVAVIEGRALASLLQCDATGGRHTRVVVLDLPSPPEGAISFEQTLRDAIDAPEPASSRHGAMVAWARRHIIEPLAKLLVTRPTTVLWCPGAGLRLIAPQALWPDLPVASALTLPLLDLRHARSRKRSTLVFMADPGETTPDAGALGAYGRRALTGLVEAAALRGPVRQLASVGALFGQALVVGAHSVRDTAASAKDLLAEAPNHDVLVIIAHGAVESPTDAALLCVNARGETERLHIHELARTPDAFLGATVVLLTCDGGRLGDSLAEPGGLAGTLLAAGARAVVAPLWPVYLDAAERVAAVFLQGLAEGVEPWVALARCADAPTADGPAMGPSPTVGQLTAAAEMQRLAFVIWVG